MKRVILSVMLFIMLPVALGVFGVTTPPAMKLKPGEVARFEFQIQATDAMTCVPTFVGDTPLDVSFDDDEIVVNQGLPISVAYVRGTVKVPDTANIGGNYHQKFCVSCEPAVQKSGVGTKFSYCTTAVDVTVVSHREKGNVYVSPKKNRFPWALSVIVLLALIILGVLVYVLYDRRKGQKNEAASRLTKTAESKVSKVAKTRTDKVLGKTTESKARKRTGKVANKVSKKSSKKTNAPAQKSVKKSSKKRVRK